MIGNVVRTSLLAFRRDRAALALTFMLPIIFFTIFAAIMSGRTGGGGTGTIDLIIVDEDGSRTSKQLAAALEKEKGIDLVAPPEGKSAWTAADAEAAVRAQDVPVALVIPAGFGSQRISFGPEGTVPRVRLLADTSDPVAPSLMTGLLQKAYMGAAPASMAGAGLEAIDRYSGGLTEAQRSTFEQNLGALESQQQEGSGDGGMLLDVEVADILGESKKNPASAFY
ncbi:MAG TPA: ABC transporter permease, partial [Thermoanaerobaculia bacterium]|nr:ABC transporter permease [Thermoanaerobaculia bacterium]